MTWAMSSGAGAGSAVLGWRPSGGPDITDIDDQQAMPVQPGGQISGGERGDRGRGIGEYECDSRGRQCGIDRQIGRPGFQHRQHRHNRLGRAAKQQRHILSWACPVVGQQMRQPIGGLVELAVGPRTLPAAERHRIRGAGHLRGEQHRNRTGAAALWVKLARLPISSRWVRSPASSRSIDDSRRAGSAVIATSTRLQSLDERFNAGRVEHVGVVLDAQTQFGARLGLHRQRVMVVFAAGDVADGQFVVARQRDGVDRIVLVHEQGVEQFVVTGDAVDLVERQVLVIQGVVVGALQLVRSGPWCWLSA